jgi:hypothetical protein
MNTGQFHVIVEKIATTVLVMRIRFDCRSLRAGKVHFGIVSQLSLIRTISPVLPRVISRAFPLNTVLEAASDVVLFRIAPSRLLIRIVVSNARWHSLLNRTNY